MNIPYPKRKVITEDDGNKDDKQDHKVMSLPPPLSLSLSPSFSNSCFIPFAAETSST